MFELCAFLHKKEITQPNTRFDLNCDVDTPEFRMMGVSYRVLDINNSFNTLTVARVDY